MRVIMLSGDPSVLKRNSPFRARAEEYVALFDALYVIVPAAGAVESGERDNLQIFAAGSMYGVYRQAVRIAKALPSGDTVITAQDEIFGVVAELVSKRFGIGWQLQIHTDVLSAVFRRHSFKNRVRSILARMLMPRADGVRVVSKRIAESVRKSGTGVARLDVAPIRAEVGAFAEIAQTRSYEDPEFEFVFLMACRLSKEKRVDLAIRAFSRVVRDAPKTLLRIVGDGPERTSLEALARSLGISTRVQFEGWKEDVKAFYALDHAFVSSSRYEGYGLAIVEAMAAGMPVIATDTGIAGDLLRPDDNGLVVAIDSEDELTEAMLRVRKSYELRWKLGHAAANVVSVLESKEAYLTKLRVSLEACLRKSQN